jgi:TPR repeat protein
MITIVSHLALGAASVLGQAATSSPAAQPPQQQTSKPSSLSSSEIRQLQAKAEAGDAGAQATLGKAYRDGNGVHQDDALALKWSRKAAEQGDAAAENDLGIMYRMGEGVERDKEEAVRWYHKSAKQGNARAMFNFGASYYNGDGVEADDVASYAWFLLAQEAGNSAADEALQRAASEEAASQRGSVRIGAFKKVAEMYAAGDELAKNPVEELKWYRKAADAGDTDSAVTVTKTLLAPGRNPTQEEYGEARQRCKDAAEKHNPSGAYCMAMIYRRGIGVAKDPAESTRWLRQAAELGLARASIELGEAYWKGDGIKADPVAAYMWIWLAYNSKVPGAEQDEQQLSKELSDKQVQQAKQKASEWAKTHWFGGLRQRPPAIPPAK